MRDFLRMGLAVSLAATPMTAIAKDSASRVHARLEAPDCKARVGYDRDMVMPGYKLPTALGPATCVAFSTAAAQPPAHYHGDFYVDEFTDAKLRERYRDCMADEKCAKRVQEQVDERHPPNREARITDPHALYLLGKVAPGADIDL